MLSYLIEYRFFRPKPCYVSHRQSWLPSAGDFRCFRPAFEAAQQFQCRFFRQPSFRGPSGSHGGCRLGFRPARHSLRLLFLPCFVLPVSRRGCQPQTCSLDFPWRRVLFPRSSRKGNGVYASAPGAVIYSTEPRREERFHAKDCLRNRSSLSSFRCLLIFTFPRARGAHA